MVGIGPETEGHSPPRQQLSGAQLGEPPAAHPLGDQRPFVLGHRSPYLQQELVVGILAHRPLHELYSAAALLQFLEEQHLVDVLARQPVRRGNQQHLELGHRRRIPQGVESGAIQARTAVALVEVDVLFLKSETFLLGIRLEPLYLLTDVLSSRLAWGRNPSVDCRTHHSPPPSGDRKSTRLNSSHANISYAVFCLKKKK